MDHNQEPPKPSPNQIKMYQSFRGWMESESAKNAEHHANISADNIRGSLWGAFEAGWRLALRK